jgi:hypothetical protein
MTDRPVIPQEESNPPPFANTEDPPQPLSLEQIKAEVRARHRLAVDELKALRADRDKTNASIKRVHAQVDETARILRSLEPRTRKAKP